MSHWYESGTFWTAAGVIVTLFAGAAAVLVTYVVGFPKRRLLYGMPVAAPLVSSPAGTNDDLELQHHGIALAAPHILEIRLASRGRADIPSTAYDDSKPIIIDVHAQIIDVLKITSRPESFSVPKVAIDGTSLKIGPSLIGKRQDIAFTVLADGGTPQIKCRSSLVDVRVRQLRADDFKLESTLPAIVLVGIIVGTVVGALWAMVAASTARTAASLARTAAATARNNAVSTKLEDNAMMYGENQAMKQVQAQLGLRASSPVAPVAPIKDPLIASYNMQARIQDHIQASESHLATIYTWVGFALIVIAPICVYILMIILQRRKSYA